MKMLLALLAALTIALCVWLFGTSRAPEAGPPADASAGAAPRAGATSTHDGALPEAGGTGAATADGAASARHAVVASPAVTHRVRVVRRGGATPVAGAEVLFHLGPREDFRTDRVPDLDAAAGDAGTRRITGADGRVPVPAPDAAGYAVFARATDPADGALFGRAEVTRDLPAQDGVCEIVIEVEPDRSFDVLVLDAERLPAPGIEVVLAEPDDGDALTFERMRLRSGPDGIARFAHAQAFVAPPARNRLVVGLPTPLRAPVRAAVDLDRLPAEPIVLAMPPAGALVLAFVDEEGQRFAPSTGVWLHLVLRIVAVDGSAIAARSVDRYVYESPVTLRPMGLGLSLELAASCEEAEGSIAFDGPTQAGEVREVRVPLRRRPLVTGRLFDAEGVLLVDTAFRAMHIGRHVGFWQTWPTTDARGVFRMPVPPLFENAMAGRTLVFAGPEPSTARAAVRLDAVGDAFGVHDLGDVHLGTPPVVVRGIVVDLRGAAIAGADVEVHESDGASSWQAHAAPRVQSDAAGDFELRGHLSSEAPILAVACPGYRGHREALPARGATLNVVLRGAGAVHARVALGAIDPDSVSATLLEHATGARRSTSLRSMLRAGAGGGGAGELRWSDVEEGLCSVWLDGVGVGEPLHAWRDVEVRAGQTTRLPDADLATRVQPLRLTVVDRDGQPLSRAVAFTEPHRARLGSWAAARSNGGVILLQPPRLPVDVAVLAPGHRRVLLPRVAGDRRVVLERGAAVRVQLDGPAWPDSIEVELRLEPATAPEPRDGEVFYWSPAADPFVVARGDGAWHSIDSVRVRTPQAVELHAPGPGQYVVRAVADPDGRDASWRHSAPFEVADAAVAVALTWDAADLATFAR